MQKNYIASIIKNQYFPFFVFFIMALIMDYKVILLPNDDEVFKNAFIDNGGPLGWIVHYRQVWSGRVVPHFILVLLLNTNLIVWKVLNGFIIAAVAVTVSKLCVNQNWQFDNRKKYFINSLICCLLFMIPSSVIIQSTFWITGSLSYLWPLAAMLIVILLFKKLYTAEKSNKGLIILSFPCAIFASFVEQSALVLVCFTIFTLIYCVRKKIKVEIYHLVLVILIIASAIYSMSAVGNSVRYTAETLRWFPSFDMFSTIDKMFFGLNFTFSHLFLNVNVLVLIMALLLFCIIAQKTQDIFTLFVSSIPILYTIIHFFSIDFLYQFIRVDSGSFLYTKPQYLSTFLALVVSLLFVYLFFIAFDKIESSILVTLFWGAAICSSMLMGFSPTIYASGDRVFYFTDIFLVFIILFLTAHLIKNFSKYRAVLTSLSINFIMITLFIMAYYIDKIFPLNFK
jgi:hypothetical protein